MNKKKNTCKDKHEHIGSKMTEKDYFCSYYVIITHAFVVKRSFFFLPRHWDNISSSYQTKPRDLYPLTSC